MSPAEPLIPASFREAARKASRDNPSDVQAAFEAANCVIRHLPEFGETVDAMVNDAIRSLVYDARHQDNVRTRKEAGHYGQPPKVEASKSQAVKKVYASMFKYVIAGTVVAHIKGGDMDGLAAREHEAVNTHAFHARLLKRLRPLVPDDKEVREAITDKQFHTIFVQERDRTSDAA